MSLKLHGALSISILCIIIVLFFFSAVPLPFRTPHSKPSLGDRVNTLDFNVEQGDLVAMTVSDTANYGLNEAGKLDYAMLMPSGGHTVHIATSNDSAPLTYTVALFHQLKCLEIYHREYLKPLPRQVTAELRGCLNYLRQSLLCHADTRLESVKNSRVQASKQYDTICRDWTKVYEAAERNYADFKSRHDVMQQS